MNYPIYKCLLFLLVFHTLSLSLHATPRPSVLLQDEISSLNDSKKFSEAITRLHGILTNTHATPEELCEAYIQKALTYKSVYNYAIALEHLESASDISGQHASSVNRNNVRILIEKFLIYYELKDELKYNTIRQMINEGQLHLLDPKTRALYLCATASIDIEKEDFQSADLKLNQANELFKNHSPKDLPNVFREKMKLYTALNLPYETLESYKSGIFYAEKYRIERYAIMLYEAKINYLLARKDYERAETYYLKAKQIRKDYDANNTSSALIRLENKLEKARYEAIFDYHNILEIVSCISAATLFIVVLTLIVRIKKINLKRQNAIEENNFFKTEIRRLTEELDIQSSSGKRDIQHYGFTERQLYIIDLVKKGKTNKQIGEELFISENTVKYHLKSIYESLGVKNRSELRIHNLVS